MKFKNFLQCAAILLFTGCSALTPQKNLTFVKQDLTLYHDSGKYEAEQKKVTTQAIAWINWRSQHAKPSEKAVIVFDIDETTLSNWPYLMVHNYGFDTQSINEWIQRGQCPVIAPSKNLYDDAIQKNVAVIFITGRPEKLRAATIKNLKAAGYTHYACLIMEPNDYKQPSVISFKSNARQSLTNKGYTIIANIGDQWSDLRNGYSERVFKLPNPFYFLL